MLIFGSNRKKLKGKAGQILLLALCLGIVAGMVAGRSKEIKAEPIYKEWVRRTIRKLPPEEALSRYFKRRIIRAIVYRLIKATIAGLAIWMEWKVGGSAVEVGTVYLFIFLCGADEEVEFENKHVRVREVDMAVQFYFISCLEL